MCLPEFSLIISHKYRNSTFNLGSSELLSHSTLPVPYSDLSQRCLKVIDDFQLNSTCFAHSVQNPYKSTMYSLAEPCRGKSSKWIINREIIALHNTINLSSKVFVGEKK